MSVPGAGVNISIRTSVRGRRIEAVLRFGIILYVIHKVYDDNNVPKFMFQYYLVHHRTGNGMSIPPSLSFRIILAILWSMIYTIV